MDFAKDPLVGKEIDGYRILKVLGRGGMGVVYEALDVELSKTVALKMMVPELASDESFLRRFREEGRTLARIDSPYIIRVYALRRTAHGMFIVMEYVEGITLGDYIRDEGTMSWERLRTLIPQMLTALEHAHTMNVIHRDIKPSNIMITPEGQVKLADFGLAKVILDDLSVTVTAGIAGTLNYMSPEQVTGNSDLDHRSDLYSLGMTIYELLTGRLPFERTLDPYSKLRAIVESSFPPPDQYHKGLSKKLGRAVMKALGKNPADRYQSAAQMRAAFKALDDALPEESVRRKSKKGESGATQLLETDKRRASRPRKLPSNRLSKNAQGGEERKRKKTLASSWMIGAVALLALSLVLFSMWVYRVSEKGNLGAAPIQPDSLTETKPDTAALQNTDEQVSNSGDEDVSPLLARARELLEANQLLSPEHENAYTTLQAVLRANPENQQAQALLGEIAQQYRTLGDAQRAQRNYRLARESYQKSLQVQPNVPEVEAKLREIEDLIAPAEPEPEPDRRATARAALNLLFSSQQFVRVEAGTFNMGSDEGEFDEGPVHQITISRPFEMGKYEVTQAQFRAFIDSTGYQTDAEKLGSCRIWNGEWVDQQGATGQNTFVGDNRPVVCVSWNDAQAFLQWLNRQFLGYGYRLPTEAQWEYAARAGSTGDFAGDAQTMGWYVDNSGGRTHALGQKKANAWGLYDMHGNVWEWVQDVMDPTYYKNSPDTDPRGPSVGENRVVRGGSWFNGVASARASNRNPNAPSYRSVLTGFRIVRHAR